MDFNSKKEVFLRVPSLLTASKSPCYIQLNLDELKSKVYDEVLDHICTQMSDVIMKNVSPRFIFLCGVMSRSMYLRQRLQVFKPKELVILSEEQLSAAQGAIYYGLNKELQTKRVAPMSMSIEPPIRVVEKQSYYDFSYDKYTHVIGIGN